MSDGLLDRLLNWIAYRTQLLLLKVPPVRRLQDDRDRWRAYAEQKGRSMSNTVEVAFDLPTADTPETARLRAQIAPLKAVARAAGELLDAYASGYESVDFEIKQLADAYRTIKVPPLGEVKP
jgi:hypothetical protein